VIVHDLQHGPDDRYEQDLRHTISRTDFQDLLSRVPESEDEGPRVVRVDHSRQVGQDKPPAPEAASWNHETRDARISDMDRDTGRDLDPLPRSQVEGGVGHGPKIHAG
jgi:hypothetical protein